MGVREYSICGYYSQGELIRLLREGGEGNEMVFVIIIIYFWAFLEKREKGSEIG